MVSVRSRCSRRPPSAPRQAGHDFTTAPQAVYVPVPLMLSLALGLGLASGMLVDVA